MRLISSSAIRYSSESRSLIWKRTEARTSPMVLATEAHPLGDHSAVAVIAEVTALARAAVVRGRARPRLGRQCVLGLGHHLAHLATSRVPHANHSDLGRLPHGAH